MIAPDVEVTVVVANLVDVRIPRTRPPPRASPVVYLVEGEINSRDVVAHSLTDPRDACIVGCVHIIVVACGPIGRGATVNCGVDRVPPVSAAAVGDFTFSGVAATFGIGDLDVWSLTP